MRAKRMPPGWSFVIPCYDEELAIEGVVRAVVDVAGAMGDAFEVLVVDDGSADGSAAVVGRLATADARIRVLSHPGNRGYGAALRTGFAAASFAHTVLLDGDGQLDPADLPRLAPFLSDADLVAGYREGRADPPLRRALGATWTAIARRVLGTTVRDLNCAFKIMPTAWLQGVTLTSDGATISAEVMAAAARDGLRIAEAPVRHAAREAGVPTGAHPRVIARAVAELMVLGVRLRMPAAGRPAHAHD